MYWRRFRTDSIPLDDPIMFDKWLRARWAEKDRLLGIYYRTGRFPADRGAEKGVDGKIRRGAGYIESEVKAVRWYEFLQIFAPVGLFAMVLYMFYGAIPKQMVSSTDKQVWSDSSKILQKALSEKPRIPASSVISRSTSKANADSLAVPKRKSTSASSGKPIGTAKAKDSALATQKTASSNTNKSNSKTLPRISVAPTRKIPSSVPKSSNKAKAEDSRTPARKTPTSHPMTSEKAKEKASKPVARSKTLEVGLLEPKNGTPKKEKPTAGATTAKKSLVEARTQESEPGGPEVSRSVHNKIITKTRPINTSSSSRPAKKAMAGSLKTVTPKIPPPNRQHQLPKKQLHLLPESNSAPKKLASQSAESKGAIKSPSNTAVPKKAQARMKRV